MKRSRDDGNGSKDEGDVVVKSSMFPIFVRHRAEMNLGTKLGIDDFHVVDVTSRSQSEFVRLSPFYPIGNIPIPCLLEGKIKSQTTEAVWQALKLFENEGIKFELFGRKTMTRLKRGETKHSGKLIGHYKGPDETFDYGEAHRHIYLPTYTHQLKRSEELIERLRKMAREKPLVLLDYTTGTELGGSTPLSHAALVRHWMLHGTLDDYDVKRRRVEED